MLTRPFLTMTLANDRADTLRGVAAAHRLVLPTRERRHAGRPRCAYWPAPLTKQGQPGSLLSGPITVRDAS
jgi:hypothetical protein